MSLRQNLQLLRGDFQSRKDGRQQEVSEISRQIKHLALNLDVPVVALSQLNRRVEEKGREGKPQLLTNDHSVVQTMTQFALPAYNEGRRLSETLAASATLPPSLTKCS